MNDFNTDLHRAVAEVCQRHELGMLSRLVLCAEVVEEDGTVALLLSSSPRDMPAWDRQGMLRYAMADLDADVLATRVAGDEEGFG
ncbi:hypothetical protein ABZ649_04625 [Streptomyces albidoflavus]|uniref:hypothetical protein n=1 Tax=Streptomyces albidoflavus TaxID=1886 RepID=UPI0034066A9E